MTKTRRITRRNRQETTVYRGPVHLPAGALDNTITRINIAYQAAFTTTAGGILSGFIPTTAVTTCTDWASCAALHQEYRVVAMEFKYQNLANRTYVAAYKPAIGLMGVYHIPTTAAPTSLDEVVQNSDNVMLCSNAPLTLQWKARGTEEMAWIQTSATSGHGGFKYWAEGGAATTAYGFYYITFLVEFRGRQ